MGAYEKVLKFLQENEGIEMEVGIHAHSIASYITLENWIIEGNVDFDINISDEKNTVTIVNDESIESCIEDNEKMNVFPNDGNFELYTKYATICFKLM